MGENLLVKIGDFGMSRDVYSTDYYRVGVCVDIFSGLFSASLLPPPCCMGPSLLYPCMGMTDRHRSQTLAVIGLISKMRVELHICVAVFHAMICT